MKRKTMNNVKNIVYAAIIAAIYVVLTEICAFLGLSSGVIQVRLSEALNVLVCFTPTAIPGLYIGCLIANLITGAVVWDVLFGSLATLIGAIGAYVLRKYRIAALMCPVVSNAVIVPLLLKYAYNLTGGLWFFVVTVAIGELISSVLLGYFLGKLLDKYKKVVFK